MYNPNGLPTYPQNGPYQQPNSSRPFHQQQQQQQFGPRFQTPSPQFTPPRSFYQPPQQHHDHSRSPYQVPVQPQRFYQSNSPNLNQTPKPPYQSPVQNFENVPNPQYPPPPAGSNFNQLSISPYRIPEQTPIQNYNHLIQNYNQSPIQNYNDHPPIHDLSQPPPIKNYNPPVTPPFQPASQNCHQPMTSPYQSPNPGYGLTPNIPFQPPAQSPDSLKQPYHLPVDQCYQQHQSFNPPRHGFNHRPPFRSPGHQRFPLNHQQSRYQQPQHGNNTNNRFQFHPRQQYQNYRPRGPPPSFNNQPNMNGSNLSKKDKPQIACEMGDCDFVGHAGAIREHQNLHHRLGLHKKVLYSNNSDAVKNWIEERKKKWPTKETIQIKSEVEDEKNKRGERIADEDFNRFNKNNKFNNTGGSKRFNNNRKRPRFSGEYVEPVEEPMNGNLKRFAGIADLIKEEATDETNKPAALKLLESYDEYSDNTQSDDEPPEETSIVKESAPLNDTSLKNPNDDLCSIIETDVSNRHGEIQDATSLVKEKPNDEPCSTLETKDVSDGLHEVQDPSALVKDDSEAVNTEMKTEISSKVDEECEKTDIERGQKRKKPQKKEFKPIKRTPPMRTPRTEVMEKKSALLEALMGDLMRKERNTITQCICYIRKNMHRFCKIQAA